MKSNFLRAFKAYRDLALFVLLVAGSSVLGVFVFRLVVSGFSENFLSLDYVITLVKIIMALVILLPAVILSVVGIFLVAFKMFGAETKVK
ncbi:hypothetical protein [Microbulbifer pacificus]|uniref:LptF/LptG family permease n=1 Tax=Microbulbifer pacificus TaxID=407164 RepID=A0AAU0MYS2_9GAMM|nr:hypothetical protein [Microbulbifer pacificus]WOX05052.1 hypothetical protein R5R33_15085 [Microbulbifer pacificus]